jgi:hypothetical protein
MFQLPDHVSKNIDDEVRAAFVRSAIVNVSEIVARVQGKNWSVNVAREDMEHRALHIANQIGAVVLFDSGGEGLFFDSTVSHGVAA